MNSSYKQEREITLLEIGIILVVLGILTAILIPTFLRPACIYTNKMACMNNLRELYRELEIYKQNVSAIHSWPTEKGSAFWNALRRDPTPDFAALNTVEDPRLNRLFICPCNKKMRDVSDQDKANLIGYRGPNYPDPEHADRRRPLGADLVGQHDDSCWRIRRRSFWDRFKDIKEFPINVLEVDGSIEDTTPGQPLYNDMLRYTSQ